MQRLPDYLDYYVLCRDRDRMPIEASTDWMGESIQTDSDYSWPYGQ